MRLQSCEKQWAGALLSVKCCCFVRKPSWKSHAISLSEEEEEGRETIWPSGDFLVRYFCNALLPY